MSLPDTAEYWWDVKKPRDTKVFIHAPGLECGHKHHVESKELREIDCYACKELLEKDLELKARLEQNNGRRYLQHRKKKGYTLSSIIRFGKYKGRSIQWIINNDNNYFQWVKDKLLLHPEVDIHIS